MTSKVKREAPPRSLFDPPGHGLAARAARSCGQREGSQGLNLRSGDIQCSTLRRLPTATSPRGTNRTRPSALPPSLRSGRRTRSASSGAGGYATRTKLTLAAPEKSAQREGVRYRAAPTARLRGDVVTFRWEMLLADSETVLAGGLEFLIVDDDGRILADHPFAVA